MKKIIILTSDGGGGNLSASNALEGYLKDDYNVQSVHVFKDLLLSLDFVYVFSFKRYSGESLYNSFMPKKQFRFIAVFYYIGILYIQLMSKKIRTILYNYFAQTKPDHILSVIPIINDIVLSIAQELDIPFLLIPTDLDTRMYILNIKNPSYKNFKICLPFHDKDILQPLIQSRISADYISIVGAALKPNFFEPKNNDHLKEEFLIPPNKPIIMVMMGAQGSSELQRYAYHLLTIENPVHLLLCIGKNSNSKAALRNLTIPAHITISIIEYTQRIADLMTISDIILSKSGSISVCEAIYTNTPLLLDATSTILPWEKFNHTFIKTHQLGLSITKHKNISPIVSNLISNAMQLEEYKNNLKKIEKLDIKTHIKNCLKTLETL